MRIDRLRQMVSGCRMPTATLPLTTDCAEGLRILQGLRPELAQRGVRHLWLFGSRARQAARVGSDWDLLVEFKESPGLADYMNLKFWLEEKLGGTVDLVSRSACKPRFIAAIQDELLDVA